jgi:hypothetical protein
VIKVLQSNTNRMYMDINEEHNRVIASKKFIIDNCTYVYNFHFQETDLDNYVIIEDKVMDRLLYSLIYVFHQISVRSGGSKDVSRTKNS